MRDRLRYLFEIGGSRRMLPMEGLRGFAVFLVFLQHYTTQNLTLLHPAAATKEVAETLQSYGNYGVELFFILSGYLIYGALIRKPSFVAFMKRRVQRIYPAFLIAFGIALVIHLDAIPGETTGALLYVGANLLLLPGLFPVGAILPVAWSLSYEIFFYIATAALVVLVALDRWPRRTRVLCILALAAALCALSASGAPMRMLPFFAGMLLAEFRDWPVPGWLALGAPVVAFLLTAMLPIRGLLLELTHTAGFFLLCAGCFRDRDIAGAVFRWTPLRWLGNMSYSYYLVHGFAVVILVRIAAALGAAQVAEPAFWALAAPVFIFSLPPAALLFIAVERPFSLKPRQQSAPAPATATSLVT